MISIWDFKDMRYTLYISWKRDSDFIGSSFKFRPLVFSSIEYTIRKG